jgi:hypothetical protein
MHGSMYVSGTYSCEKNEGVRRAGAIFSAGSAFSPAGGKIRLPPSASLPAAVRLHDFCLIPPGVDDPQFPVLFARNGERNRVRDENRGDRELLR